MKIINSIFKTFVLSLLLIAQVHFAYAQSAALLPNATQVFLDNNGKPLSSGTINFYIPGTTTPKMVWQDASQTTPWTQPITLNAAGRPPTDKGIYGNGTYRQIVKDRNGGTIWDQPTSATGTGGGAGTSVGDGNSVGTILQWGGMLAPSQYQFSYGQALSRTVYPELYQALTQLSDVTCIGGNVNLTGLSDTSNIPIGANVEGNCISPGSTVVSKTLSTVTLSIAAVISVTTSVRFFPYGNGDGSTTFNAPDLRGKVLAGRTNMGGVTSSNLTSTYFGSNPDAVGANGGSQSHTLSLAEMAAHDHGNVVTGSGTVSAIASPVGTGIGGAGVGGTTNNVMTTTNNPASTISVTQNYGIRSQGGVSTATSATVAAGGSGYTNGSQIVTLSGGTCTTQPSFTVTVVANAITAPVLANAGSCTLPPLNPASLTGGGGSGGTLTVSYSNSSTPFSIIQPTLTLNYIIKVTPDTSVSGLFGVASIGGMQGIIACGSGLTCAGNIISAVIPSYPTQAANTVLANTTASTAAPIANALPSCSSANQALNYTSNTGFGCITTSSGGVSSIDAKTGAFTTSNGITTSVNDIRLASIAADTLLANSTGSSGPPIATSIGSCSSASSALTYNTSTHSFGCNTISGSGTVNSGTINQLAYYAATGTAVSGNANVTVSSAALRLGVAGSTIGSLLLSGNTSGTVTLISQAAAGTPTITFGTSSGTPAVTASAPLAISTSTGNVSITGASGQVLAGATPAFTATPTLGASGTIGTIAFGNATSGTVTLGTVTGALGSAVMSLPAATDTIVGKATTDTFTNKTYDTAGTGNSFSINGVAVTANTGTGAVARATSPTFVTPTLGVALATTINGNTWTSGTGTLTIAAGKTLTYNNSITIAGTDSTTMTFPSTNANVAALNIASQSLTGGVVVTPASLSTGNITVNCGTSPIQTITNNGAYTITAPAADGYCLLKVTNGASAGATSFSGFSVGSNTGDNLTTTNTNKFIISIIRAGGDSTYSIKALQ